jgi:hypothetical protein
MSNSAICSICLTNPSFCGYSSFPARKLRHPTSLSFILPIPHSAILRSPNPSFCSLNLTFSPQIAKSHHQKSTFCIILSIHSSFCRIFSFFHHPEPCSELGSGSIQHIILSILRYFYIYEVSITPLDRLHILSKIRN